MESGGQPGNKNATKDKRLITDALRRTVVQGPNQLKAACEKILENAANGDIASFNVIADRLDGKPLQSVMNEGSVIMVEIKTKDAGLLE